MERKDTVSTATAKDKRVKRIVGVGLLVGAPFQALFMFYLMRRFSIQFISLGSFLYLTANLATMLVAYFTLDKFPAAHRRLVQYYFVAMPLSMIFIGIYVRTAGLLPLLVSLAAPLLYLGGSLSLFRTHKKGNALVEMWCFAVLAVWTFVMTFI